MSIIKINNNVDAIYANGITVNFSMFEARFEFLRDTPDQINKVMNQETVADIRMSPQLAKAISMLLLQQVENYESQFGAIKFPDNLEGKQNA